MAKLPKNAKVGDRVKVTRTSKGGKKRIITFEKQRPFGKNKNLSWKIKSNRPG